MASAADDVDGELCRARHERVGPRPDLPERHRGPVVNAKDSVDILQHPYMITYTPCVLSVCSLGVLSVVTVCSHGQVWPGKHRHCVTDPCRSIAVADMAATASYSS